MHHIVIEIMLANSEWKNIFWTFTNIFRIFWCWNVVSSFIICLVLPISLTILVKATEKAPLESGRTPRLAIVLLQDFGEFKMPQPTGKKVWFLAGGVKQSILFRCWSTIFLNMPISALPSTGSSIKKDFSTTSTNKKLREPTTQVLLIICC